MLPGGRILFNRTSERIKTRYLPPGLKGQVEDCR